MMIAARVYIYYPYGEISNKLIKRKIRQSQKKKSAKYLTLYGS